MKKIIAALLSLTLVFALVGCGGSNDNADNSSKTEKKTITVGASSTPHAEILEQVKDDLAAEGYTLNIRVFDDYILPNTATEDGEIDANYFQHTPYLDDFNKNNGTHLVSVVAVHYEPFGIYAGKVKSIAALTDGSNDGAKIAVPNDDTNEARALQLLAAQGLIKLKDGVGLSATKLDIVENPHKFDIVEMQAALLPGVLDDVAVAVINGNYAISGGLKAGDAIAIEDSKSEAAKTYANILVVKDGNQNSEAIQALAKALTSEKVKKFIEKTYDNAVVAMF